LWQCVRHLGQLEACCQRLAQDPELGRACDQIRPGLFRYEQGKHVTSIAEFDACE
jgi:plasmid stabilization system protein ParE